MLIHVHVNPTPVGDERHRFEHVEAALRVIEASGLDYEVGALGTTVQGEPDRIWPLMRELHEATLASGANSVMTHVRIAEKRDAGQEISMADLAGRVHS